MTDRPPRAGTPGQPDTSRSWSSPHERAHELLSARLDAPLTADESVWLASHLEDCAECRLVDADYRSARDELRGLPRAEPPRDLWARTAVALEAEERRARRPFSAWLDGRRTGVGFGLRTGSPLGAAGAILAVFVVGVVIGSIILPGASTPKVALHSPAGPSSATSGGPATPIAVQPGDVAWVTRSVDGSYSIHRSQVEQVCPSGSTTPCATLDTQAGKVALVAVSPKSVYASPGKDQVIVLGQQAGSSRLSLFVVPVAVAPTSSQGPSPAGATTPASTTGPTPGGNSPSIAPTSNPTEPPTTTASPIPPTAPATPVPTEPPGSSAGPSAGPSQTARPIGTPPLSTIPPGTPAPTAASVLAIASDLVVVGQRAAYSPDGVWFAFSARPASAAGGSDIYVWRAGDAQADPLTTDGRSVFSAWVGGRLVGSRSEAPTPPAAPAATDPGASSGPASVASASPATIAGSTVSSFLIDPASRLSVPLAGTAWRPVVDPTGRLVVYWAGTVAADPVTGDWASAAGRLVIGSWPSLAGPAALAIASGASSSLPGASAGSSPGFDSGATSSPGANQAAASSRPTNVPGATASTGPTGSPTTPPSADELPAEMGSAAGVEWDAAWDETGQHLAIWIGDAHDPSRGLLSLVTIDPVAGGIDPAGLAIHGQPALSGFSLSDGHLAWATPTGADAKGSGLQVFAWSGPNAGSIFSEPGGGTEPVVVVQH